MLTPAYEVVSSVQVLLSQRHVSPQGLTGLGTEQLEGLCARPGPQEGAPALEEDAVQALHLHPLFTCLSGQCQPVLWAACACLKVFGVDNLISARPFLASLSTC